MAYFDAERGAIVMRVVYDGLGASGRTTNLQTLQSAFPTWVHRPLVSPGEASGRTLFLDWLELTAGDLDGWPLRCQLLSVPGQFIYAARRFRLLQNIDSAVLVCDSTGAGVEAGRLAGIFLECALKASGALTPVVLQANKQDAHGALDKDDVANRIGLPFHAVVPACASSGEGVRYTLVAALDAARNKVRTQLDGRPADLLPQTDETPDTLHRCLGDLDGAPASQGLIEALERTMAELK